MKEFMLLYKGGDSTWVTNASAADRQEVMAKWGAWLGRLGERGQLVNAHAIRSPCRE